MAILLPLLTLFLLTGNSLHGQDTARVDSLTSLLQKSGDDTNRVKILNALADEFCYTDPKKSLEYAEHAFKIAKYSGRKKGIGNAYNRIASAYYGQGNYSVALEYWAKELKIREELNDKKGQGGTLGNIGTCYDAQSDYVTALKYYIAALKIAETMGDTDRIIAHFSNIARVYKAQGNLTKAMEYHLKSLKLEEETRGDEMFNTANLGSIGGIFWIQGNYHKALEYYFKALKMDEKSGKKRNIAAWLANIGGVYGDSALTIGKSPPKMEMISKALEYYSRALKLDEELGDNGLRAYTLGNIGCLHTEMKHYSQAEEFLQQSLELAIKINLLDVVEGAHYYFSRLYEQTHEPAKALEHYKKHIAIKDSIFNEKNKKTISELQIKYETEKKESENKALAQKNKIQELLLTRNRYIMLGLAGLLILIVCLGTLLMRHNKLKSQKLLAQFEQKLLRTQMNPHFIFNSLASIESFIYEHQPKEAGIYLSNFSRLIRLILENSTSEFITLEKEIETLNFYLSLEKLRLNDNLEYTIEVDKAINPDQIFLPPMLTQPFIENAIEHGFRGMEKKGSIKIFFRLADHTLQVQVTDNGIGIAQAQQQKDLHLHHKSLAMQITRERLKFLNKSKKQKLDFDVTDVRSGQGETMGTKVTFTIPLS